jgi:hypothetical protein
MWGFVAMGIMILLFGGLVHWAYNQEKREWNDGKCLCGERWQYFDTDSQGGRGYKCVKCKNDVWISYRVDKEYKGEGD